MRDAARIGPNGELSNRPLIFNIHDHNTELHVQCGFWPRNETVGLLVLKKLMDETKTYGESEDEDDYALSLIESLQELAYGNEGQDLYEKRVCGALKLQDIQELGELHLIRSPGDHVRGRRVKRSQLHPQLNERFFETS